MSARYGDVLATLLVAHNVADHVVQTDHQAAGKATRYGWAGPMAGHVGTYQATQALALAAMCAATGQRPSWRGLVAGSLFSAVTHAFLDRRWPVKAALRATGSADFAEATAPLHGTYLADQALHHGCLLISALMMTRKR